MKSSKPKRNRVRQRKAPPEILALEDLSISDVRPAPVNARVHSDKQIAQIAASMRAFGFTNPVLVDEDGVLIAGHGRLEAAKNLGRKTVPAIRIRYLSAAQKRALALADNKIAENATWDRETLAIELKAISLEINHDLEITGFSAAEIDVLLDPASPDRDPADEVPELTETAVSQLGDIWLLGDKHRLMVGDIRDKQVIAQLMDGQKAEAIFVDPPYNVKINGHVRVKGGKKYREFKAASGEMSETEFDSFLNTTLGNMAAFSKGSAIAFVCIDWRHIGQLLRVGAGVFKELKNVAVWVKNNGGMGSFYRSQHEMVVVFKVGSAPHQNNISLGKDGRYRTNVWAYTGTNSFHANREEALDLHPTVKPVMLVADAIKDVTRRGQIVLDGFAGSGTTLIAAEKTGRVAYVAEIDPLYADVIIRRWEALNGKEARHGETGRSFTQISKSRAPGKTERAT